MTDTKPCPVCAGSTDPFSIILDSLCDQHLAEVKPPTDEEIEAALEEGRKARDAVAATEGQFIPPRGFFR